MRISIVSLLLCFAAAFGCNTVVCSVSHVSASTSEHSASTSHSRKGKHEDEEEFDTMEEEEIEHDLDEAEERFEENEKMLEDTEDIGVKEDIEEEEIESEYAHRKMDSYKHLGDDGISREARTKKLMEDLAALSEELQNLNLKFDEL